MKKVQFPKELLEQLKTQSDVEDVVGGIYKQLVEHMLNLRWFARVARILGPSIPAVPSSHIYADPHLP